jgi:hypothetical protein
MFPSRPLLTALTVSSAILFQLTALRPQMQRTATYLRRAQESAPRSNANPTADT